MSRSVWDGILVGRQGSDEVDVPLVFDLDAVGRFEIAQSYVPTAICCRERRRIDADEVVPCEGAVGVRIIAVLDGQIAKFLLRLAVVYEHKPKSSALVLLSEVVQRRLRSAVNRIFVIRGLLATTCKSMRKEGREKYESECRRVAGILLLQDQEKIAHRDFHRGLRNHRPFMSY